MNFFAVLSTLVLGITCTMAHAQPESAGRPSPRELGITIGSLPVGEHNDITDVPGVRVGHTTVIRGDNIRTGVTAVLPHGGNIFLEKVPGAMVTFNGFGKLAGSTQVNELGNIETPVLLTNTLAVPRTADAVLSYMLALPWMEEVRSINPLVGETNDGFLNDIRERAIREKDVISAIQNATDGPVEQGSVGAGTGTGCLGFKGGIGSSSRLVEIDGESYTVGVLAQTNFGGVLRVNGVKIPQDFDSEESGRGGSCILVAATDAPLGHRNLARLAKRLFAGMARTGANFSNGSGDYAIAFSTHPEMRIPYGGPALLGPRTPLANEPAGRLFAAAAEAAEEAIISSLTHAATITGRDNHVRHAIDIARLKAALGLD
ncbi:MAG: P1 family peptidase [Candidatus Glassbacteria bacterium]|nr:P1 family peptidase [Candidatus Glassbacteria bacterium]